MALSLLSVEDGANTCIVSASGADVATLDALPGPDSPSGTINSSKGLWARNLGSGRYIIPVQAARELGLRPKEAAASTW